MRFDLTDLRLFLTVVERGSLTQGAQAMNLALASASERISGMEAILGTPLLERNRRGVRPTPAGDALIRNARLILQQVEQMRGELRSYSTGLKGRIRLLSNTAALMGFLPEQLRLFLAAHPDLSIDLDERPSAEIVPAVAEGRAELGLVADSTDLADLQTRLIARDQLVVVVSKTHRIAEKSGEHDADQAPVAFADIMGEAFVGLADAALATHLGERAARIGGQIHYRVQLRSVENVLAMVESGIGIAILSQAAVAGTSRPGLCVLPLQEPWTVRQLYLCARDFSVLTPQAELLAQQLLGMSA